MSRLQKAVRIQCDEGMWSVSFRQTEDGHVVVGLHYGEKTESNHDCTLTAAEFEVITKAMQS